MACLLCFRRGEEGVDSPNAQQDPHVKNENYTSVNPKFYVWGTLLFVKYKVLGPDEIPTLLSTRFELLVERPSSLNMLLLFFTRKDQNFYVCKKMRSAWGFITQTIWRIFLQNEKF